MLKKTGFIPLLCLSLFATHANASAAQTPSGTMTIKSPAEMQGQASSKTTADFDMNKLSEAFGNFIGRHLQSPGLKFDVDYLIKGIRAGAAGEPSPLTDKEYEEMMAAVQEHAFKEMSETNLKSANEFLEKNKQEKNVTEIVPGKLQYIILKEGSGETVKDNASPKIHYTGKYQDGTVFGNSEETGGPITIPLSQTIPGFSKGITGMKEGEKRRLFVHPDLGYGTTGQLPPNELLIFDVEVISTDTNDKDTMKPNNKNSDEEEDEEEENEEENDNEEESKVQPYGNGSINKK